MIWLFSQDFLKGSRARRRQWGSNVAWLHLAWAGVYYPPSPPPPDLVVHVGAPLLAYVLEVLVACSTLTSFGAWGPGLPSIHRLGRARALPLANTIFNSNYNSNLNVKSEFQSKLCHHILDVGSGGVHCLNLAWHLVVGGSLAGPPPTDWVVHARYHLPILN